MARNPNYQAQVIEGIDATLAGIFERHFGIIEFAPKKYIRIGIGTNGRMAIVEAIHEAAGALKRNAKAHRKADARTPIRADWEAAMANLLEIEAENVRRESSGMLDRREVMIWLPFELAADIAGAILSYARYLQDCVALDEGASDPYRRDTAWRRAAIIAIKNFAYTLMEAGLDFEEDLRLDAPRLAMDAAEELLD